MRRVTLMLAAMGVMVTLFAGVAYAATIEGTSEAERLLDSDRNDTINGRGGGDQIRADAFGASGTLITIGNPPQPCCGADTDVANGNAGNDFIVVDDGDNRDTANGGAGTDTCVGDTLTELNCENESVGGPNPGPAVSQ
jgi:RTX calcium-binding nonapeptide repeat (4 copies)